MKTYKGVQLMFQAFSASAIERDECSAASSGYFNLEKYFLIHSG
jgi:hypothetical protein